jgi:DNA-binding IscR family transcriptional regulator
VVALVDGEVAPVECVAHGYETGSCMREGECASRPLWQRLKQSIDSVLSATTLEELVADHSLVEAFAPEPEPAAQATASPHDHEVINV